MEKQSRKTGMEDWPGEKVVFLFYLLIFKYLIYLRASERESTHWGGPEAEGKADSS